MICYPMSYVNATSFLLLSDILFNSRQEMDSLNAFYPRLSDSFFSHLLLQFSENHLSKNILFSGEQENPTTLAGEDWKPEEGNQNLSRSQSPEIDQDSKTPKRAKRKSGGQNKEAKSGGRGRGRGSNSKGQFAFLHIRRLSHKTWFSTPVDFSQYLEFRLWANFLSRISHSHSSVLSLIFHLKTQNNVVQLCLTA